MLTHLTKTNSASRKVRFKKRNPKDYESDHGALEVRSVGVPHWVGILVYASILFMILCIHACTDVPCKLGRFIFYPLLTLKNGG